MGSMTFGDGLASSEREDLGRRLTFAAAGLSGEEALSAIATAYRRFADQHPGVYTAVERAPAFGADPEAMRPPVDAVVAALRGYGLTGDDETHAVRVVRAALHGFISLEASGGFALKLDLDETFARLVGTLAPGSAARVSLTAMASTYSRVHHDGVRTSSRSRSRSRSASTASRWR